MLYRKSELVGQAALCAFSIFVGMFPRLPFIRLFDLFSSLSSHIIL